MTADGPFRTAVIAATGCDLAWLADALQALGWIVHMAPDGDLTRTPTPSEADLIVHCHMPPIAKPTAAAAMSNEDWHRGAMQPMLDTLATLRAAPALLGDRGAVIGLGPAFALNGTAGLVALATAAEGQRTLVKAVARQWLSGPIVCNWIAVATEMLLPALATVPNLGRYAIGTPVRRPPGVAGIAALVDAIAGAAGRAMAGQTLIADGGDWMVP